MLVLPGMDSLGLAMGPRFEAKENMLSQTLAEAKDAELALRLLSWHRAQMMMNLEQQSKAQTHHLLLHLHLCPLQALVY